MVVPVAPAPSRNPLVLFLSVTVAVTGLQIVLNDGALWRSIGIGVAAGLAATAVTWALNRRAT